MVVCVQCEHTLACAMMIDHSKVYFNDCMWLLCSGNWGHVCRSKKIYNIDSISVTNIIKTLVDRIITKPRYQSYEYTLVDGFSIARCFCSHEYCNHQRPLAVHPIVTFFLSISLKKRFFIACYLALSI